MKDFLQKMYVDAEEMNTLNVKEALSSTGPHTNLLDVGCWDGLNTRLWIGAANVKHPFDLTNSSYLRWGIGNPLAMHRGESDKRGKTWTHKSIYTAHWLVEWQQAHGFTPLAIYGARLL